MCKGLEFGVVNRNSLNQLQDLFEHVSVTELIKCLTDLCVIVITYSEGYILFQQRRK